MVKRKRVFSISITIVVLMLLWQSTSFACSCAESPPPLEALEQSAVVFTGVVKEIDGIEDESDYFMSNDPVTVTLEVTEIWKGLDRDDTEIQVRTALHSASCGFVFSMDQEYIVYTHLGADEYHHTGLCSRTALRSNAEEDLVALGEGLKPKQQVNSDEEQREEGHRDEAMEKEEIADGSTHKPIISIVVFVLIMCLLGVVIMMMRRS